LTPLVVSVTAYATERLPAALSHRLLMTMATAEKPAVL